MGAVQDRAASASLTCEDIERFLRTAKVGARKDLAVGVTIPSRATLSDGVLTHDAAIQAVEESKSVFRGTRTTELNFRDSWRFNVAGYELAKLLRLNMVPPYVERRIDGAPAAVSWWVNDAMMERERYQSGMKPPDTVRWNREMYTVRVFRQLIHDTDPNLTNLLITKDWRVWMIDFTRAFRQNPRLRSTKDLAGIDRTLLARLRELKAASLHQHLGTWLDTVLIDALDARRQLIVKHFDAQIATRGEAPVLYDTVRTTEPCGTGLY